VTDGQTDRQTDKAKTIMSPPEGGRHNNSNTANTKRMKYISNLYKKANYYFLLNATTKAQQATN